MEWLGVVLLYLISGFMKKRQQNARRREIESDSDWDSGKQISENVKESSNPLDQLFDDLFEDNPKSPESNPLVSKIIKNVDYPIPDFEKNKVNETVLNEDNQVESERTDGSINENIYHSKLAERDEQHFGRKWIKKFNIRKNLFKSKDSIKKSMIIKEVLDKPLTLRK
ncbi:MAG: hypothetical protein CMF94_00560 [Candidatus Marinimicrobia bacterium]|nr:hypothetical protein [Candidatus Neomarinimicrobiota bacterium]